MKTGKRCKSEPFVCLFAVENWFTSIPLSEGESNEMNKNPAWQLPGNVHPQQKIVLRD